MVNNIFPGVETEDLGKLLDFIYEGEAKVEKQRLDSFLQLAQDLQIMGLVTEGDLSFKSVQGQQQHNGQPLVPRKKKRKLVPARTVQKKPKEVDMIEVNHPIVGIEEQASRFFISNFFFIEWKKTIF